MSAGKGSKPRPVKGDAYRQNYDNIFRKTKPDMAEYWLKKARSAKLKLQKMQEPYEL
ncbi:MAG: hypothetical protein WCL08_00060 [Verrucomicrobiota bacterium]